jgi:hypothetical protein
MLRAEHQMNQHVCQGLGHSRNSTIRMSPLQSFHCNWEWMGVGAATHVPSSQGGGIARETRGASALGCRILPFQGREPPTRNGSPTPVTPHHHATMPQCRATMPTVAGRELTRHTEPN